MALTFNLSEDDFLKGRLVQPGWQSSKIVSYEEKTSKEKVNPQTGERVPPSQYIELKFQITDGPDKGAILYNNFSEKAPGFIIPFMEALMGAKLDPKNPEHRSFTFTKDKLIGKFIDVEVIRGSYNGKPQNQVNAFKPFTGTKS